ncbi:MAG: ligase-associated DNA damage response DEXH box helicase [Alphaproteobacteria bacterium]|nr:ligase-associated DNA damage response DEXH box helicase [Alphaproteobacteria bacterium]
MVSLATIDEPTNAALPPLFAAWFASRGWSPRPFQLALVEAGAKGQSVLLTAPTGGGKTLAGFLPSLIELSGAEAAPSTASRSPSPAKAVEEKEGGYVNPVIARLKAKAAARPRGVHTLYLSPLKALAVDIARNLDAPAREMQLPVKIETRTGDTSVHRRQRQRHSPPDLLLTTPEQLALLLATGDAQRMFGNLRCVILDELHALAPSKRGDLLSLDLARLSVIAPGHRRVGLSATVDDPDPLRRFLVPQARGENRMALHIRGAPGATPNVSVLASDEDVPWAGHMARHALIDILQQIKSAKTALVFVNTRMQAEFIFQQLWSINDENLPIALHHGSLSPEQRRKVEAAMATGTLRAVVCTSTLDLGIDWGAVDLVINVGAPKGASRIAQRIGRSNHRMNEPSRALLVPANRFEVLECEAARDALMHGELDGEKPRHGALDVLAQHVLGMAVSSPFDADALYGEVISASPYRNLPRADFDKVLDYVATGGYALRAYERYAKLKQTPEGLWRIANPRIAQRYRLNAGTIVEVPMLKVRVVRNYRGPRATYTGRVLGQVEEWFLQQLTQGDTFLFAGQILRFEGIVETDAIVTPGPPGNPKIPSFEGGKFPLSTFLARRVREMIADSKRWQFLPEQVKEWLAIQRLRSLLPRADQMLVETFPRGSRHYLVCYPFDGRLCHQSLGMLLTRRLERIGAKPLGFVASEYSLALWALRPMYHLDMNKLFDEDMLGDDLDAWLAESALLKRSFRQCAVIAGLIEKRHPAEEKSGRQVTFSSDLIYDVLRSHQPDHILLQAAYEDAAAFALDINRLGDLLRRIKGNIVLKRLDRVSPLAVPALLDIGKVPVGMEANEYLLAEASEDLIAEAMKVD